VLFLAGMSFCGAGTAVADQVVMQNGDTYNGTVVAVTTNVIILQNPNLGNINLPRAKAAAVFWGTAISTNHAPSSLILPRAAPHATALQTNPAAGLAESVLDIRAQTNLIRSVQTEMLGTASPEANAKFRELLDGLSTGKMDLNGLQSEARSAAEQLRALKKELGPDADGELDSYLAILENFLKETTPARAATNTTYLRLAPAAR